MQSSLKIISFCSYLTDVSVQWRPEDHTASKMVKALKGDDIKGYFDVNVGGTNRRFDNSNIGDFVSLIPRLLAKALAREIADSATIVPIPNSHVTHPDDEGFKIRSMAEQIAKASKGQFSVVPALVFKAQQQKSRGGGHRSPYHFEEVYEVVGRAKPPIVLLDDVVTGGGHLIAACWKLGIENVAFGCTFGATTQEQRDSPFGRREIPLSLERIAPLFEDDF
jgi:hypothetical protein